VTDRFHEPERATPNDPRRIFIPAPSGDSGGKGGGTGAPPRPGARPGGAGGARGGSGGGGSRGGAYGAPPGPGGTRVGGPNDTRVGGPGAGRPIGPGGPPPRGPGRDRPEARRYDEPRPSRGGSGRSGFRFPFRLRRPRLTRILIALPLIIILLLVGGFLWARSVFNGIERVDTEGELDNTSLISGGTNYLMVGSDSREVIEGEESGFTDGQFPGGQRSDTMVVLHVGGDGTKILSIPRDLYVPIADTGDSGKINGAFNGGPPRLLRTISDYLDIPIHRYIEVDFVSFAGVVDGLGGITIDFPNPVTDPNSGLNITQAGPVELDGEQALAYVRSRHYTESIDGQQVEDPRGDIGRIERQQLFLSTVFAKLSDTKNPIALARTFSGAAEGLRIDDEMGLFDGLRLAWAVRGGLNPEPLVLPTTSDRNESGAVLILSEDEAQPILDQVR